MFKKAFIKKKKTIEDVEVISLGKEQTVELKTGHKTLGKEKIKIFGFIDAHDCSVYDTSEGKLLICETENKKP